MLGNLHVRFGVGVGVQIPGLHHEIKACCRLAALLEVSLLDASGYLVPVAITAAESLHRLRTWANGRCLSAQQPGVFQFPPPSTGSRRKVKRETSLN